MMQVFLHLERDEDEQELNTVMENLSRSMLRNRAMSRSLSIPSKSTSYHSLQNEAAASTVTTDSEINTGNFFCFILASNDGPVQLAVTTLVGSFFD